MKQIAERDLEAFEGLSRYIEKKLFVYLTSLLNSVEAAEEILNDVLLAIWRQASLYQERAKPLTWIFAIARNKAFDRLKRRPLVILEEGEDLEALLEPEQDHENRFANRELVRRALSGLSDEHREVIELVFYAGFSYAEIAEIVHIPINTVKTRMHHAKRNLREALKRQCP